MTSNDVIDHRIFAPVVLEDAETLAENAAELSEELFSTPLRLIPKELLLRANMLEGEEAAFLTHVMLEKLELSMPKIFSLKALRKVVADYEAAEELLRRMGVDVEST